MNRKMGKFEAPVPAKPAKQNKDHSLLRTYFTSLISLVLCAVMFLGTTMAWFTADVTSAGNEIYVGTLKVQLDYKTMSENSLSVEWTELKNDETTNVAEPIFSDSIRWEPGYTAVRTFRLTNLGDLAFKYRLTATIDTADIDATALADMKELAGQFTVYALESAAEITPAQGLEGWTNLGSLADVLFDSYIVADGEMELNEVVDTNYTILNTTDYFAIAITMNASADAKYMGKKLSNINIKLVAYQQAAEDDAFGSDYDAGAEPVLVGTNDDFAQALGEGKSVELLAGDYTLPPMSDKDVTISGTEDVVIDVTATPNAGNSNISFAGVTVRNSTGGFEHGIQHSDSVTYTDVTIEGSMSLYGNKVVFNNCTFDLTGIEDYIWTYGAKEVEFNNCVFNTLGKAILIFNEGTVGSGKVTVNNCEFNATQPNYALTILNQPCAAIEIDSSLVTGYELILLGNNVVGEDFSGTWRVKASNGSNVTVNGVAYSMVTLDKKVYTLNSATKKVNEVVNG